MALLEIENVTRRFGDFTAVDRVSLSIEAGEFSPVYQPIVILRSRRIAGVEALVRWHDPNGGIVPPGEFIPLAEELG